MVLHTVALDDDDITAAALLDIAASDFIDGEDTAQDRSDDPKVPSLPTLHDIALGEYDTQAASVISVARILLQPVNWPESRSTHNLRALFSGFLTDSGGAIQNQGVKKYREEFRGEYNIPLPKTLNWINPGNSQWQATTINADLHAHLHMSYDSLIPVPDGGRRLRIRKAAGGDQTGADIWSGDANGNGGWNERLDDESPGLDSSLTYLLTALGGQPQGAADDILKGIRWTGKKGNKVTPAVLGPGNALEALLTPFTYDTATPIEGSDAVGVQTCAAVVHTPVIWAEFLEIAAARNAGVGVTTPAPGSRGGMPSAPGRGGGLRVF